MESFLKLHVLTSLFLAKSICTEIVSQKSLLPFLTLLCTMISFVYPPFLPSFLQSFDRWYVCLPPVLLSQNLLSIVFEVGKNEDNPVLILFWTIEFHSITVEYMTTKLEYPVLSHSCIVPFWLIIVLWQKLSILVYATKACWKHLSQ